MKKILFSALAAIGLLFTPACSDESELLNTGNEELVTFTVSVADGLQTKAISDGSNAKWLVYEVYEANDNKKMVHRNKAKLTDSEVSWTIQLKLVKEKQYDIAFWAQTQDPSTESDYYDVSNLRAVKVKYDSQVTNKEERDAFCHIEKNYVVSSTTPTVQLKRPFAQLNFLASKDHITDAKKAGLNFAQNPTAAVTVEDVADTYDVLTGAATNSTTVSFSAQPIPFASHVASNMNGAESHTIGGIPYYFIATNYILPYDNGSGGYSNVKATLTVHGGTVSNAQTVVENAPVKPNHRTNIYGHLLTAEGTFNVEIQPEFAGGDKNQPVVDTPVNPNPNPSETTVTVNSFQELKNALVDGNIATITLGADITLTENLTIDRDVTIDGGESNKYGFKDDDGARNTLSVGSDSDVTFDNVSFANSAYALSATNYAGNLTINNCSFYVDGMTGNASTNGSISIGTASSGAVIVIENNTFINGKLTRAAGGAPAAGKYIAISSSTNTNCTNTIRIVGNTFDNGNLTALLEISNQSAATTTIGKNTFPADASKISVSFYDKDKLSADDFLAAFKGDTETLVSSIE